jgi:hypothetical protein
MYTPSCDWLGKEVQSVDVCSSLVLLQIPFPMRMTAEPDGVGICVTEIFESLQLFAPQTVFSWIYVIQIASSIRKTDV